MSRKVTYGEVVSAFAERECTLLSKSYVRAKEKLDFICVCGRVSRISYDKFRSGQLCGGCKGERAAIKRKYSLNEAAEIFRKGGCVLLETEYTSNKARMSYRCNCGNMSTISLSKFMADQRCRDCRRIKISKNLTGPKNPRWRVDLTEADRVKSRTIPGYNDWRQSVFEQDDYTCIACGIRGGRLNAHHIEGYARVPEGRVDVGNGVTLCEDCHNDYHHNICHSDGDIESFTYFMSEYRHPWYAGEEFEQDFKEAA